MYFNVNMIAQCYYQGSKSEESWYFLYKHYE